MNKYKRLVSNSIIFALGNLTVKAAQFFILPLLTKYLMENQYGVTENMVVTIQDLIMPIFTLGLAEALFRFSVDKRHSPTDIITNALSVVLIGVVAFSVCDLAFYFIMHGTGSLYGETFMLLLIPLFAFKSVKNLLAEFTRGIGKTVVYAISSILESGVMLLLAYLLIIFGNLGIYGYIIALIAAPLTGIIFLSCTVNPLKYYKISSFDKFKLKIMLKYSIPNVSNNVSWWIVQTSSKYMMVYLSVIAIAGFSGSQELYDKAWAISGVYTAASKLPSLINVVSTIFLQAWSLSSAQESESKDHNEFYSRVFKFYSPMIFLATTCLMLVLPYVSKLLLKGDFYSGWTYSPLLIMGAVAGCFSAFFGAFFGVYYKTVWAMITTLIGAGVNLVACLIFMPIVSKFIGLDYVVYVAIGAFFLSYNAIFLSRVLFSRKLVQLEINWLKFTILYAICIALAIVYTINWNFKWICALAAIIVVIAMNIEEIKFIVTVFVNIFKKKVLKKAVAEGPASESVQDGESGSDANGSVIDEEKENRDENEKRPEDVTGKETQDVQNKTENGENGRDEK